MTKISEIDNRPLAARQQPTPPSKRPPSRRSNVTRSPGTLSVIAETPGTGSNRPSTSTLRSLTRDDVLSSTADSKDFDDLYLTPIPLVPPPKRTTDDCDRQLYIPMDGRDRRQRRNRTVVGERSGLDEASEYAQPYFPPIDEADCESF